MSRSRRSPVAKVALAMCLVALTVGGTLLAIGGSSGAASSSAVVDHQLCYTATATGFKIPPNVVLEDQFATKGFAAKVGPLVKNCNPVQKTVDLPAGPKVTRITNPNAHLACFKITAPTQPTKTVVVTNQFGSGTLSVGQPQILCLPTWKSLTGPPQEPVDQPPYLSHFTCYSVTYVAGTPQYKVPGPVSLRDEFTPATVGPTPVKVGAPKLLCLPTTKIVDGTTYKLVNAKWHLLCFSVSKTPIRTPVFDLNQFGKATVNITKTNLLCLPSTKKVISS